MACLFGHEVRWVSKPPGAPVQAGMLIGRLRQRGRGRGHRSRGVTQHGNWRHDQALADPLCPRPLLPRGSPRCRPTFRLAPDVDVRAALKRAALTAVPKVEGWTLCVFTVKRTMEGERVTAVLDCLARAGIGRRAFAAALASTLAGSSAVLVTVAKDPRRVYRVSFTLSRAAG